MASQCSQGSDDATPVPTVDEAGYIPFDPDDATAVEAVVDRLVHHAEVIVLQGESYRLKDRANEVVHTKSR